MKTNYNEDHDPTYRIHGLMYDTGTYVGDEGMKTYPAVLWWVVDVEAGP